MSAANTDNFLKAVRKRAGNLDSSGIANATVDNFGFDSASGLPTDTAITIVIDRVDANGNKTPDKEEEIIGVVSGDRLIDCVRGVSGTAQAHSAGAVWEVRLTAAQWNRMIAGFLAEHTQSGQHDMRSFDEARYGADAGSDDAYVVTLSPAPSAYYVGMLLVFKANTANTGAAAINVNDLGAKTIKKKKDIDLSDGDIRSGQIVAVCYDGTNFQMLSEPKKVVEVPNTPTAGGTATLDLSTGKRQKITMPAGNITIAISNANVGDIFMVEITQDATGSRTVTWFPTIKWAGGTPPTLTTTANKRDTFGFIVTGSGTYDGYIIGMNI